MNARAEGEGEGEGGQAAGGERMIEGTAALSKVEAGTTEWHR